MTEIGFYHLTRTALDQALPKLLGRVLAQAGRAQVLVGNAERLPALDDSLWKCADPDWLPHGTAASGHAEMQPIWLTADGAQSARLAEFDRVFDLFDGNDEAALAAARARWKAAKEAGHLLSYWQQGQRGWEKKA